MKELDEIRGSLIDALLEKRMGKWKQLITIALEKAYWIGRDRVSDGRDR